MPHRRPSASPPLVHLEGTETGLSLCKSASLKVGVFLLHHSDAGQKVQRPFGFFPASLHIPESVHYSNLRVFLLLSYHLSFRGSAMTPGTGERKLPLLFLCRTFLHWIV